MTNNIFIINERMSYSSLEDLGRDLCLYEEVFINAFDDSSFRRWLLECNYELGSEAIQLFNSIDNKSIALFKISHLFNYGLPFVICGYTFNNLKELGDLILNNAPKPIEELLLLVKDKLILDFLKYKRIDNDKPEFYKKVESIVSDLSISLLERWFNLGFFLTLSNKFYFEGDQYEDLKSFFILKGHDERIMTSYDFLSMPYIKSYCKVKHIEDELIICNSLCDTNNQSYDNLIKLLKKK